MYKGRSGRTAVIALLSAILLVNCLILAVLFVRPWLADRHKQAAIQVERDAARQGAERAKRDVLDMIGQGLSASRPDDTSDDAPAP